MKTIATVIAAGIAALACGVGLMLAAAHYGWLDAYQSSTSTAQPAGATTCAHNVDADRCPFCNPGLTESLGWCSGHDVPEAVCTRCHPEIIPAFQAQNDWCAEHNLPESQCTMCNGENASDTNAESEKSLSESIFEQASRARPDAKEKSDPVMRSQRKPSPTCTNAFSTVVLDSPKVAQRAGIQTQSVLQQDVTQTITCNAEVAFDGDRYAHLAPRAPGTIVHVNVDLGENVEQGDILAVVDSSELGSAKAALLQARSLVDLWAQNYTREEALYEKNVATEKDVLEARTKLVESRVQVSNAKQRLRNLGLSDDDIQQIIDSDETSSELPLRAPFAGTIVERHAVPGEVVSTSRSLFAIADTSTMWVMLDVYESDIPHLRAGQRVQLTVDAMADRTFAGELTWISSHVDRRTRTIRARAEVDNPDRLLRANMFGRAEIEVRTINNALLVPENAVQWDGCCNLVFVRRTETVYQPYQVTLGYKRDGYFVVENGVPAGESVVTEGSFLMKTEILKGNIGAGCCEVDPGANRNKET